jgi:hypothetical protein
MLEGDLIEVSDLKVFAEVSAEICQSDRVRRRGGKAISNGFRNIIRSIRGQWTKLGNWLRGVNTDLRLKRAQLRANRRDRMERKFEELEVINFTFLLEQKFPYCKAAN